MKRWIPWVVGLMILGALAAGVARAIAARKAQQATAAAAVQSAPLVIDIAPSDVVTAEARTVVRTLPVSGSLKAVNAVFVKAKAAGELVGLRVREGEAVKAGEVIARIDPSDHEARLRQAQEQADSAKAQIDNAQRQWDNNKALVDQGFISKTALDTSWNNFVAAQATHKAALASVELARKALDDTWVRAPIAGWVAQRLAQPGERVSVDARVVEIVDLGRMELEAVLSPADALDVRVGQMATIEVEGNGKALRARVGRINPSAQSGSRGVLAYLSIEESTGLRQGLFAQGRIELGSGSATVLPLTAVRTDRSDPYVIAIDAGMAQHRRVQVGAREERQGETYAAIEGLAAGTRVLRGSAGALRDGTAVRTSGGDAPPGARSPAAATPASSLAPVAAKP